MTAQLVLVPQISTLPAHEQKARALLRWLVKRRIVEALRTGITKFAPGIRAADDRTAIVVKAI